MNGKDALIIKTDVRYPMIGLICWVIGAVAFFSAHNLAMVGQQDVVRFTNVVFVAVVCWATIIPSQVLCCAVIRYRDGMLVLNAPKDHGACIVDPGRVPWIMATVLEAMVLIVLFSGVDGQWARDEKSALRDLLLAFSIVSFFLSLVMAMLYKWFFDKRERCNSVRVLVAWPSLLVYGMNLMGGCASRVYVEMDSFETVLPYMMVFILFTAAYLLFDLLLSTERGFLVRDGGKVSLPGPYSLIPFVLFLVCSYLGRPECLFALLGCIFYSTFEALRVADYCQRHAYLRSDNIVRWCEAIAGIARVLLLPATMIIVSFSLGRYEVEEGSKAMADEAAIMAYVIVVVTSLIVLSGYISSAVLKRFWPSCPQGGGRDVPAALRAAWRRLLRLGRWLWHPFLIALPAAIVLAPFIHFGNVGNLAWLPRDASRLVAALGVFGGVAGVFSFAYSTPDGSGMKGSSGIGPAAVRERLEDRMESYLRLESFLSSDVTAEDIDDSAERRLSYGHTMRDMLIVCIFASLVFGAMFSAPGEYFYCFGLMYSVILIVSYFLDFFFARRGLR